jgi:hypothetical protein
MISSGDVRSTACWRDTDGWLITTSQDDERPIVTSPDDGKSCVDTLPLTLMTA